MSLPVYLAMTAAEFARCSALPPKCGYMACHFSPYGTGLSNLPRQLPPGSLLILNDRIPLSGHDGQVICHQLAQAVEEMKCDGVLLDFQRQDPQAGSLAEKIAGSLPCPVAVTPAYTGNLDCPVFLMPPVYQRLSKVLEGWAGREIWLELGQVSQVLTVTKSGCDISPLLPYEGEDGRFYADSLACRYTAQVKEQEVVFTLSRNRQCLDELLQQAEALGVRRAVGLYQELGSKE